MCNKTIYQTLKVTRYLREDSFIASRTLDLIVLEHSNFLKLNLRFLILPLLALVYNDKYFKAARRVQRYAYTFQPIAYT
ncbi:uncharacterized protein Bfra_005020 [Botrytis fragariae]|uniref:Uncharacterized protein n=1 Tax=Botrytis fragariae TaxID=1964551 RepID=A0A8H6EIJ7_9HELO|nr:uncharacterized protein Bfra_005020 [Botrytis fragariae]KAF5873557.1 hypothetical protein Bfra_005020 [Botrytis fragariae]